MTQHPHYSMVIAWSDEDQVYIVSLPEWGDMVHTHGATYTEAVAHGTELLEALIATRQQHGEPLPAPQTFVSV